MYYNGGPFLFLCFACNSGPFCFSHGGGRNPVQNYENLSISSSIRRERLESSFRKKNDGAPSAFVNGPPRGRRMSHASILGIKSVLPPKKDKDNVLRRPSVGSVLGASMTSNTDVGRRRSKSDHPDAMLSSSRQPEKQMDR